MPQTPIPMVQSAQQIMEILQLLLILVVDVPVVLGRASPQVLSALIGSHTGYMSVSGGFGRFSPIFFVKVDLGSRSRCLVLSYSSQCLVREWLWEMASWSFSFSAHCLVRQWLWEMTSVKWSYSALCLVQLLDKVMP